MDSLGASTPSRPPAITYTRTLAALFIAAGALVLATLNLGVDEPQSAAAIAALAIGSMLAGALLLTVRRGLGEPALLAFLILGVLVVSATVVAAGEADSPFALLYIWVGAEAWYFTRPRSAATLLAVALAASAVAMAWAGDSSDLLAWWVMIAGSMLVVGVLAGILRLKAAGLIDSMADAAMTDVLTGLLNRRGYRLRLDAALADARSEDRPLSVLLGDLDHFKALNDAFGHRRGDEALVAFAEICSRHIRETDFVCRVGGEEFVVVLPNADADAAMLAAERLRRAVAEALPLPAADIAADIAADLSRYLQQARDGVVSALDGLSEYDIRRPMTPSGTNLLGLVKHLTGIEIGYLGDSVGRPSPVPLPWVDDGSVWDGGDMWATAAETRHDLVALYRTAWRHSDESIAALGLAAPAQVPWWPEERRATTLGSLVVRVVAETAQHAGHADIVREMIDGRGGPDSDQVGDGAAWARYVERIQQAADSHRGTGGPAPS